MKKYILGTASLLLIFTLVAISGEIALRVYYYLKYSNNQLVGKTVTLDEKFGWLPTPNYVFIGNKKDAAGNSYSVNMQTDSNGFRMFGNPRETNKKKILFLGDSFTHAVDVSNDKTFYGVLNNRLPIEVFAFGGGGYGTLQEYMVLDKYVDEIEPDIIILEYCSNDFINNHYELEVRSYRNNNGMRRPYLAQNGIVYRTPKNFYAIREFANKHSRFLYFIFSRVDRLQTLRTHSVEDIIEEEGVSYPLFRESVEITDQLIKNMKSRIPSTTIVYAFSVDDSNPYYDEFRRISKNNGINFIDGIPQALRDAKRKGVTTKAADNAHWNEAGHQIVANVLEQYLEANW